MAASFGTLLTPEKTERPATEMIFFSIVIDKEQKECELPENKLNELKAAVAHGLRVTKNSGNFACRTMPMR